MSNTNDAYERCVMCGKLTNIPVSLPIDLREEYEIGCGQICGVCRIKMREETESNKG